MQNDLFDVGADLSVPAGGERERLRVVEAQTQWLEKACDEVNAELPALKSFVLPGGTVAARRCTSAAPSAGARSGGSSHWVTTRTPRSPAI